jgi:PemK-like, MazF-like toxin of type II toxin-antitoxin system
MGRRAWKAVRPSYGLSKSRGCAYNVSTRGGGRHEIAHYPGRQFPGAPHPEAAPQGTEGQVGLDQLRTVDVSRLVKKLGRLDPGVMAIVLGVLGEMFAP